MTVRARDHHPRCPQRGLLIPTVCTCVDHGWDPVAASKVQGPASRRRRPPPRPKPARCTFEWEDGGGWHTCMEHVGDRVHECACQAWWPLSAEPFFTGRYERERSHV